MERLQSWSVQRVQRVPMDFKRYLWTRINRDQRLIMITGARGVGKTTLMLQWMKDNYGTNEAALYVSLDDLYFSTNSLISLAERFMQFGGKYLFIDEVHKYPGWSREIKILFDQFHDLHLMVTGSSAIEILKGEADLTRRASLYHLNGLSFREFLGYELKRHFHAVNLEDIVLNHRQLSLDISNQILPLKFFQSYLQTGYYPFYKEAGIEYHQRIVRIIELIIESDLPAIFNVDYEGIRNLRKLLSILAELVPYKPNIQKLSTQIGLSRETLVKYLQHLQKADILQLLYSDTKGISRLNKPEKVYLQNTNIMHALGREINKGNERETFFINQTGFEHEVSSHLQVDFIVDRKYLFEVGGHGKGLEQLKDYENAWIVADDIAMSAGRKIPLWLFGFLY